MNCSPPWQNVWACPARLGPWVMGHRWFRALSEICDSSRMDFARQLEPRSLLLMIGLVMAFNTYRLYGKRRRGELVSYDGQESPVTAFDVWLSAALGVIFVALLAYQWSGRK